MDKDSKIAFVMPWHISERGGGAEVQANYLSQELANRGLQVSYICQTINKTRINSVENIGKVTIYWLKASGRFAWMDQNKYLKPLNTIKPDYILQRLSSNVSYVIGKYVSKNSSKFLWVCTDNLSPYRAFHVIKFKQYFSVDKIGFIKYNLFLLNSKIMDKYRNIGMSHVDLSFHQNKIQRSLIKKEFKLESVKLISGHPKPKNNIDFAQRFNNRTILWCANLGRHKRPKLFVELARHFLNTNLKFVMVGGHSDVDYVNSVFENKPANLTTTGHLAFDDALSYFDEATVFVNTSAPGGDGFPNTYIQSWLRGVPVISFGFDPDDIIKNNDLGFDVNTISEATTVIKKLILDQDLYQKNSVSIEKFAIENFTVKKLTDSFLKLIETIDG